MPTVEIIHNEIIPTERTKCSVRFDLSFSNTNWDDYTSLFVHYSNNIHLDDPHSYTNNDQEDTPHFIKDVQIEENNFTTKSITINDLEVFYADSSNVSQTDQTKSWNNYSFTVINFTNGVSEITSTQNITVNGTLFTPIISEVNSGVNAYTLKIDVSYGNHEDISNNLKGFLVTTGGPTLTSPMDANDFDYENKSLINDYKIRSYYVDVNNLLTDIVHSPTHSSYYIRVCDVSFAVETISSGDVNRVVFNEIINNEHEYKYLIENTVCLIDTSNNQSLISNTEYGTGTADITPFQDISAYTGDAGIGSKANNTTAILSDPTKTTDMDVSYDASGVGSYGKIKLFANAPTSMVVPYPYDVRIFYTNKSPSATYSSAKEFLKKEYSIEAYVSNTLAADLSANDSLLNYKDVSFSDISNGYILDGLSDGETYYIFLQAYDSVNNTYTKVNYLGDVIEITPYAPPPKIMNLSGVVHGSQIPNTNNAYYQDTSSVFIDITNYQFDNVGLITHVLTKFAPDKVYSYPLSDLKYKIGNTPVSSVETNKSYIFQLDHDDQKHALTEGPLNLQLAFTTENFPYPLLSQFSSNVTIEVEDKPAFLENVQFSVVEPDTSKGKITITADPVSKNSINVQIYIEEVTPGSDGKLGESSIAPYTYNSFNTPGEFVIDTSMTKINDEMSVTFDSPYDGFAFKYKIAAVNDKYKTKYHQGNVNDSFNNDGVADREQDLNWSESTVLYTDEFKRWSGDDGYTYVINEYKPTDSTVGQEIAQAQAEGLQHLDLPNNLSISELNNRIGGVDIAQILHELWVGREVASNNVFLLLATDNDYYYYYTYDGTTVYVNSGDSNILAYATYSENYGYNDYYLYRIPTSSVDAITTYHHPTDTIQVVEAPYYDSSNEIDVVTLKIKEISNDPQGLGDTSSNTFIVLENTAGDTLEKSLNSISGRDISSVYDVTFNTGVISSGADYKLYFKNSHCPGHPEDVSVVTLFTRYEPKPPTISFNSFSNPETVTPTTIQYITITTNSKGAANYGGDADLEDSYELIITVQDETNSHTSDVNLVSTTNIWNTGYKTIGNIGKLQLTNSDLSLNLENPQTFKIDFNDLSNNSQYRFSAKLKNTTRNLVSNTSSSILSRPTDATLVSWNDGDFNLSLNNNTVTIAKDLSYTSVDISEVKLEGKIESTGDGITEGTFTYGYYIIADISDYDEVVVLSKEISNNDHSFSHTFNVDNKFGTTLDLSSLSQANDPVPDFSSNTVGNIDYPKFGSNIEYKIRVIFKDQDGTIYNDISYISSDPTKVLNAQVSFGDAVMPNTFPTLEKIKFNTVGYNISSVDISVNTGGSKIEKFALFSTEVTEKNNVELQDSMSDLDLVGTQGKTIDLSLNHTSTSDSIIFVKNAVGGNLYYIDNFHRTETISGEDLVHLNINE
jgi:hypothetical protein